MQSDYFELIRIFEQISRDSARLVEIFKKADTVEKTSSSYYHDWHLCAKENPKASGFYTIAVDTKGMDSYVDMAYYSVSDKRWFPESEAEFFNHSYEEKTGFAPTAWTKIEYPEFLKRGQ